MEIFSHMNPDKIFGLARIIGNWLSDYLDNNNLECFVVGVSGGIDSAVVSTICAMTGKKTILVSLPLRQKCDQLKRATDHCNWLKSLYAQVVVKQISLDDFFDSFKQVVEETTPLSEANTKSRLRMIVLYNFSTVNKGVVVGTGNKIEDFGVGFFTKYGDGGVDISPIADLTKTDVRKLAESLGISDSIIFAPPTDGLWEEDRTDEEQLGASYEELERVMAFSGNPSELSGRDKIIYDIYQTHHNKNKHKMMPIPVFKLTDRSIFND